MPDPAPSPDCYLRRMGWSHITPDGWVSLSHSYKRNIAGRVIATETDPAWRRDIQLAHPQVTGENEPVSGHHPRGLC